MRFAALTAAFLSIRFCWDVDAVSLNEWLLIFQSVILPLPSGSGGPRPFFVDCLTLKMKAL